MRYLTAEEKINLPHRYLSGKSSAEIAKSLKVSDSAILYHLRKMGVKMRDSSLARRKHHVKDDVFSIITPESAYWIGFLMADGCVLDESKLQLVLSKKDINHLEKFRNFINANNTPLYFIPSTNAYQLKIHSRQIVIDLATYGIVPRKTYTEEAKNNIANNPSFWLGVLDGDGCIDMQKQGRVRLYGTKMLMEQFVKFLIDYKIRGYLPKFNPAIHKCRNLLFEVTLMGQRASNFLKLLYSKTPVYLERKKLIADKIIVF